MSTISFNNLENLNCIRRIHFNDHWQNEIIDLFCCLAISNKFYGSINKKIYLNEFIWRLKLLIKMNWNFFTEKIWNELCYAVSFSKLGNIIAKMHCFRCEIIHSILRETEIKREWDEKHIMTLIGHFHLLENWTVNTPKNNKTDKCVRLWDGTEAKQKPILLPKNVFMLEPEAIYIYIETRRMGKLMVLVVGFHFFRQRMRSQYTFAINLRAIALQT